MGASVDPGSYAWLRASHLQVAGCVTVVATPDADQVRSAFGCGEEVATPKSGEGTDPFDLLETALVGAVDGGLVVVEDNGFQGTRPEVLKPASKASETGKAASIFWNVEDEIQFSCARRGKVLCSFELGFEDEDELDGLPAALRPFVQLCSDEDADLVAIGAAMVEMFTGVGFGPGSLTTGQTYALTPPASDLATDTPEHSALSYTDPELHEAIVALPPATQRTLAEWMTQVAVAEAGVTNEPAVLAVADQFGRGEPATLGPAAEALVAEWSRAHHKLVDRDMLAEASDRLETTYAGQVACAGLALQYSSHPDALTAAMRCLNAALFVYRGSRTERAATFVEDDSGRFDVYIQGPVGREPEFRNTLTRLLGIDPGQWAELRADLPTPLTADERAAALERDREREALGDFDTWQYG